MKKIVVCVKQVPEVTDVQVDPTTGTLLREGVQSILNPFCEYALDHAARIKQADADIEVIAICMGPPQAEDALRRCLELGADRAILLTDRKFAGADTWATAHTLAEVIRQLIPDFTLILAIKQTLMVIPPRLDLKSQKFWVYLNHLWHECEPDGRREACAGQT